MDYAKCKYCGNITDEPWHSPPPVVCDSCYVNKVKPEYENYYSAHNVKDMIYLKGYGQVSAARVDEVDRRILIFGKNGEEYLCRKGENGKIQDRMPDYY